MSDVTSGQEQLHESAIRTTPAIEHGPRSILATGLALLGVSVALFLIWKTVSSLLIIFAGVLFAALLDAAARAIAPVVRLGRIWRLTLVLLLLTAAVGLGLVWGAGKLPEQTRLLLKVMDTQFDVLQQHLLTYGVDLLGPEWGRDFTQWLVSDQGRFFSHTPNSSLAERRAS
ncbi:putative PurR-regulated permease PerM [Bradyrhizobium sp. LM6.10]